jgi:hypothetical protein
MEAIAGQTEWIGAWEQIAPMLDEAMAQLRERDRNAIVLRFFENKNMTEVGLALGVSEDATKKRVNRALEKLRKYFRKRGVVSTAAIIAGAISTNSVQAAPAGLVATVTATAAAKGAVASGSTLALAKGALKAITWAKYKFALGLATSTLLVASTITIAVADKSGDSGQPNPVELLKKVAVAREKITSGEMEIQVAWHDFKWAIETNHALLKIVFDGEKRRFEQLQRESAIISTASDARNIAETKRYELGGDDNALAQLGLVELQDAHYRTIYDGKAITLFDPRTCTSIHDPKDGIVAYVFDPRTLGLSDSTYALDTIENCLAYQHAQSIVLIGKENIGDIATWHVRVQVTDWMPCDIWIDVKHLTHVLKEEVANRGGLVLSHFDEQHPDDPIPFEIHLVQHYGGDPRPCEEWLIRSNTRYNVPINPKAWTLAGLGMPVGTPVVDDRIMRRIGYWTGSDLSENTPHGAPGRTDKAVSTMENNVSSLARVKMDPSFVDERKIVLRRTAIGVGLLVLVLGLAGGLIGTYFSTKHAKRLPHHIT